MVCPATNTLWQDALGSAKDNSSPINGLPFMFHLFNQSLYLLLLFVDYIHENKKLWADGWSARYLVMLFEI